MASSDLLPESPQAMRSLTAHCYCKAVHFTVTIPIASLPLPVHMCHCPVCRHTHGTLCIFHAPLPKGVQPEFISPSSPTSSLTGYKHAEALCERFFCTTCGCHIGDADLTPDPSTGKPEWRVATSIFSEHGEDTFQIRAHCFTRAAPGGGLYDWLPSMGDRTLNTWNPDPSNTTFPPGSSDIDAAKPEFDSSGNERLRAECHCGGVSFTIPRPSISEVVNDAFAAKYVSPLDRDKWVACLDLCDDCRLLDGTHVVGWTFVPLALTEPKISPDLKIGTLKTYESTKGVLRAFCGTCGATVIYSCDERAPEDGLQIVDIAVGVLRAPEGALAENWLTWRTGKIAWYPSGERYDEVFAKSLKKGHEEWGLNRYKVSPSFTIP